MLCLCRATRISSPSTASTSRRLRMERSLRSSTPPNPPPPPPKISPTVDVVLLFHPDTLHLGALPDAMKHLALSAPVLPTQPIYRLALLAFAGDGNESVGSRREDGVVRSGAITSSVGPRREGWPIRCGLVTTIMGSK
ncbi:hypothetical protein ACLOJK_032925 [Asimina triloba]